MEKIAVLTPTQAEKKGRGCIRPLVPPTCEVVRCRTLDPIDGHASQMASTMQKPSNWGSTPLITHPDAVEGSLMILSYFCGDH